MKALIDLAIDVAVRAHQNQLRKGTKILYITHPVAVGITLAKVGCSDEIIIAGILHDTVEDTHITLEDIRKTFGEDVSRIVKEASEPDKELPWEKRKRYTHEYLKKASAEVKFVALADKLNNIRAIASDYTEIGEAVWERFNRGKEDQKWYYQSLVESLRDESADDSYKTLHSEFAHVVSEVFSR
jgi:(p)ppGpp synthase/HD superfamily hydrolase